MWLGLLLCLQIQVADLKWDQCHQDGWWRIQQSEEIPDLICSRGLLGGLSQEALYPAKVKSPGRTKCSLG